MAAWALARYFDKTLCMESLLKLALVHDLGEIDAGDTFLYADNRMEAVTKERQCLARLSQHPGNSLDCLTPIWEEQELGITEEARFLKVVDRLLPFLHNLNSGGVAWIEAGLAKSQVLDMQSFIAVEEPRIHAWMLEQIAIAVTKGWLRDA